MREAHRRAGHGSSVTAGQSIYRVHAPSRNVHRARAPPKPALLQQLQQQQEEWRAAPLHDVVGECGLRDSVCNSDAEARLVQAAADISAWRKAPISS